MNAEMNIGPSPTEFIDMIGPNSDRQWAIRNDSFAMAFRKLRQIGAMRALAEI
jgi:hypothetical protein